MKDMKTLLLLLLCSIASVTACNSEGGKLSGESQTGIILNPETGKPVPDAFVVAMWTASAGGIGHGGGSICYHVENVKTNEQGEYVIPAWQKEHHYSNIKKPRVLIVVYKPGYQWPPDGLDRWEQLIEFHGGSKERLDYLGDVRANISCMQAGDSDVNQLELNRTLYQEVKGMENDIENKSVIYRYLEAVEELELGYEEAGRRYSERIKSLP